jgi:2,3-bisphosphoglycerate-dependent phosphoglycerate mutase
LTAPNLILVRHGESEWNRDNRFTGWADVDLSVQGMAQMGEVGRALQAANVTVDEAFTSVLKRCIRSQWLLLDHLDLMWIPQTLDWRLNERHYGALTGLSKAAAVRQYGERTVQLWRRDFDAVPPRSNPDFGDVTLDQRYSHLRPNQIPASESLKQTVKRVGAAWGEKIGPLVASGKHILVVGHGNALRGLTKIVEGLSEDKTSRLDILNAEPVFYTLGSDLRVVYKSSMSLPGRSSSEIL